MTSTDTRTGAEIQADWWNNLSAEDRKLVIESNEYYAAAYLESREPRNISIEAAGYLQRADKAEAQVKKLEAERDELKQAAKWHEPEHEKLCVHVANRDAAIASERQSHAAVVEAAEQKTAELAAVVQAMREALKDAQGALGSKVFVAQEEPPVGVEHYLATLDNIKSALALKSPAAQVLAERDKASEIKGWKKAASKVEDICSEFGHDPKACLGILGEHFSAAALEASKG